MTLGDGVGFDAMASRHASRKPLGEGSAIDFRAFRTSSPKDESGGRRGATCAVQLRGSQTTNPLLVGFRGSLTL